MYFFFLRPDMRLDYVAGYRTRTADCIDKRIAGNSPHFEERNAEIRYARVKQGEYPASGESRQPAWAAPFSQQTLKYRNRWEMGSAKSVRQCFALLQKTAEFFINNV